MEVLSKAMEPQDNSMIITTSYWKISKISHVVRYLMW